jgi:hypothetical protein
MRDTHTCPAPVCNRQVPYERLACRIHWYAIPRHLRDRVWEAYLSGSDDHLDAVAEAVQYLHDKYPA